MTNGERHVKFKIMSGPQLRAAVLDWFEQAVNAFEGQPPPSETDGKYLVSEMLSRGWEEKKAAE